MKRPRDPVGAGAELTDRREFLALGAGLLFVAAVPSWVRTRRRIVRRTTPVMGTIAEVGVVHSDARLAQHAIDRALNELHWVERSMSRFRTDSDLGRANAHAAGEYVPVDPTTAFVLKAALQWAEETEGRFDPALGRISTLWDRAGQAGLPLDTAHRRFEGAALYEQVDVSRSAGGPRVRFRSADVGLDLGGIAKGFAVDRAVNRLREAGIEDGLVNVGGDLYALGLRPDGEPWRVGVRDPYHSDALALTLDATDQAIATSGDYVRGFEHHGQRYHHILDPTTAAPAQGPRRSLTVTAGSCMHADAAATAAFGAPVNSIPSLIGRGVGVAEAKVTVLHSI